MKIPEDIDTADQTWLPYGVDGYTYSDEFSRRLREALMTNENQSLPEYQTELGSGEQEASIEGEASDQKRVVMLLPVVTHRLCPDCGYQISQKEIDLLRVVVDCPRGCKTTINEFQPMAIRT
jgi:hypothetical protein